MITLIPTILLQTLLTFNKPGSFMQKPNQVLATHEISLNDRYANESVNTVFKDNILLNLAYLDGSVKSASDINWNSIENPVSYEFKLDPGKTFAFHSSVLPEYKSSVAVTTSAHFSSQEGFKSDGYLIGDGVCHFASLINWAAKDAGLLVVAPTNHDFANIPDIPKEDGVAIYYNPNQVDSSSKQNLYITNDFSKPVTFKFEYQANNLKVSVIQDN